MTSPPPHALQGPYYVPTCPQGRQPQARPGWLSTCMSGGRVTCMLHGGRLTTSGHVISKQVGVVFSTGILRRRCSTALWGRTITCISPSAHSISVKLNFNTYRTHAHFVPHLQALVLHHAQTIPIQTHLDYKCILQECPVQNYFFVFLLLSAVCLQAPLTNAVEL